MDVNIKSMSDPEEDQNKTTVFPLSPEMVGSLTQQERPAHILNSKQLRKVQHLTDQYREVRIVIVNGQVSPEMVGSFIQQERPQHVLSSKQLRKVQRLADEIQTGELRILTVNGQLVIDQTRRYSYTNEE